MKTPTCYQVYPNDGQFDASSSTGHLRKSVAYTAYTPEAVFSPGSAMCSKSRNPMNHMILTFLGQLSWISWDYEKCRKHAPGMTRRDILSKTPVPTLGLQLHS